jgi:hypothetical protein
MTSAETQIPAFTTITARLGQSAYGNRQPEVSVTLPRGTDHRRMKAALYHLAAEVELATPPTESWIVQIEICGEGRGRIHLELGKGDREEAQRGLSLLRRWAEAEA